MADELNLVGWGQYQLSQSTNFSWQKYTADNVDEVILFSRRKSVYLEWLTLLLWPCLSFRTIHGQLKGWENSIAQDVFGLLCLWHCQFWFWNNTGSGGSSKGIMVYSPSLKVIIIKWENIEKEKPRISLILT